MFDLLINGFRYAFLDRKAEQKTNGHIRIGLLGASKIARFGVIKPCYKSPLAKVQAVAARDFERAKAYAAKFEIPIVYETYDDLLSSDEIDAVYIGLCTELHFEYAKSAIQYGKHVLVEKPLTFTADEASELAELAERCGVVVFEGMHYRYHPLAVRMKDIVNSGELGDLMQIEANVGNFSPVAWWYGNNIEKLQDAHVVKILNLFCYCVDIMRFILDDSSSEALVDVDKDVEIENVTIEKNKFLATMQYRGVKCSLVSSREDPGLPIPYWNLCVDGTEKRMVVKNFGMPFLYHKLSVISTQDQPQRKLRSETHYGNGSSTFDYQLEAFTNAITGNAPFTSTPYSSLQNAKIVDALVSTYRMSKRKKDNHEDNQKLGGKLSNKKVGKAKHTDGVRVCSWNLLADGMALNEFMTDGGDALCTFWNNRRQRLADSIRCLFLEQACGILVTQENDHPYWLLHEINRQCPEVEMIIVPQEKAKSVSTSLKLYITRISNELTLSHYDANDKMCEFGCNGENPGCSRKMSDTSVYEHIEKIDSYLRDNQKVRKKLMQKGITCTTNEEEHALTIDPNSELDPKALYYMDDHIVIYFNKSKVRTDMRVRSKANVYFVKFWYNNSGRDVDVEFHVFPAHLPSGEAYEKEERRVAKLRSILGVAKKLPNPIILMDSNTSTQYEDNFKREDPDRRFFVSSLLKDMGFITTLESQTESDTSQCFKMRHAQGGQPKKFGSFMFDTIDKICVERDTAFENIAVSERVFKKFDKNLKDTLQVWRNDATIRKALRSACVDGKWGPDMSKNNTEDLDNVLSKKKNDTSQEHTQNARNILLQLYPNVRCPSDHPPLIADIYLSTELGIN